MIKALTTIVMGSGAFFTWAVVDSNLYSIPLRLWALIVFCFQVATVVAVWLKK